MTVAARDPLQRLGLERRAVRDVAVHMAAVVQDALRSSLEDQEVAPDYVLVHGMRGMGLVALFEPREAQSLADDVGSWLEERHHRGWALTTAAGRLPPAWDEEHLADRLRSTPGYAAALATCLLSPPDAVPPPGAPDDVDGPSASRWSRRTLWLYGIDLELLRAVLLPPGAGAAVSEVSRPVVLAALFRSIEAALAEARGDRFHWRHGLSRIAATDPEVLLVARACVRSELTGPHLEALSPDELPMTTAVIDVARAVESA